MKQLSNPKCYNLNLDNIIINLLHTPTENNVQVRESKPRPSVWRLDVQNQTPNHDPSPVPNLQHSQSNATIFIVVLVFPPVCLLLMYNLSRVNHESSWSWKELKYL